MSLYRIEPPEPPQQRSPWLVTVVLVLIVLLLALALWFFSLGEFGLRLVATPTPSRTAAALATATPDFRSTMIVEDELTQIAFWATVTRQTLQPGYVPMVGGPLDETATALSINLPLISGPADELPLSAPPLSESPLVPNQEPTLTPIIPAEDISGPAPQPESPLSPPDTPTPPGPPVPEVIGTDTPTATETTLALPTDTPTETATPGPTVFLVNQLNARITAAPGTVVYLRSAPLTTFTPVATLVTGSNVQIKGRSEAGEWVYICCAPDGQQRWVRQAYVAPSDNPLPSNAPPSATPNDLRWLPTQAWPGDQPQPVLATPIPPDDYPMLRRDRANTGRIPTAFTGSLQRTSSGATGARISTPVIVAGQLVLAASDDRNIYGFNRDEVNQDWKHPIGKVEYPLLEQDGILYYVDTALEPGIAKGLAVRLSDKAVLWSVNLSAASMAPNVQPATGFIAADNRLFIGVSGGATYYVVRMDRVGGGAVVAFDAGGSPIRGLAIGHQLLYVAGGNFWALDLDTLEVVWSKAGDFGIPATLPVYAGQGVSSVAELYIGVTDGRTYALDANTGAILHTYPSNGEEVKNVAFGDVTLYIVSNTRIRAFERRDTGLYWDTAISEMRGAPIVSADQLILMGANGTIWFVHPGTGALQQGPTVNAPVGFAPAASGPYLFVPADNGQVYGFTQ